MTSALQCPCRDISVITECRKTKGKTEEQGQAEEEERKKSHIPQFDSLAIFNQKSINLLLFSLSDDADTKPH